MENSKTNIVIRKGYRVEYFLKGTMFLSLKFKTKQQCFVNIQSLMHIFKGEYEESPEDRCFVVYYGKERWDIYYDRILKWKAPKPNNPHGISNQLWLNIPFLQTFTPKNLLKEFRNGK